MILPIAYLDGRLEGKQYLFLEFLLTCCETISFSINDTIIRSDRIIFYMIGPVSSVWLPVLYWQACSRHTKASIQTQKSQVLMGISKAVSWLSPERRTRIALLLLCCVSFCVICCEPNSPQFNQQTINTKNGLVLTIIIFPNNHQDCCMRLDLNQLSYTFLPESVFWVGSILVGLNVVRQWIRRKGPF